MALKSAGLAADRGGQPCARPWYSIKAQVHHNNPQCNSGRLIGNPNRRLGDGGRPLCEQCQSLNEGGRY
jgi:hypothetical protein